VEAKGVPLRAGWLVEWADMYAVSAPPAGRHLGIDVDQAEGRNFCAARGRPGYTLSWPACVRASTYIPPPSRVPSHAAATVDPPSDVDVPLVYERECAEEEASRGFLREKWRLRGAFDPRHALISLSPQARTHLFRRSSRK